MDAYYSLMSATDTYDRATGKSDNGKPTVIIESDSYQEAYTRLIKEAANFLNTHAGSVVGVMMENCIKINYDQDKPVQKSQFFMMTDCMP